MKGIKKKLDEYLQQEKDEILYATEEDFNKEVLKRFKAQKGELL